MSEIPAPLVVSFKRKAAGVTRALQERYSKNGRKSAVEEKCNAVTLLRELAFVCAGAGVCVSTLFLSLQRYSVTKNSFFFLFQSNTGKSCCNADVTQALQN